MLSDLIEKIHATAYGGKRRLVALVGPPASGKSTLAEALAERDPTLQVVPMDGFHLDNTILAARNLLDRKGAPETFDVPGFIHLVKRLRTEAEVVFPLFDRALDRSIAGAGAVGPDTTTVLVEGNYLMLKQPGWQDLRPLWDLTIMINADMDTLQQRLLQRWTTHGFGQEEAEAKVAGNDLPNARLVLQNSLPCDIVIAEGPAKGQETFTTRVPLAKTE